MGLRVVLFVLLVGAAIERSFQSCGTTECSQDYDDTCSADTSAKLYDDCNTTQSSCNETIVEPESLEVDCYDTCIQGNPIFPSIPLSCCGDPILLSETISTTIGPNYLIARLYSPNEEGMDVYRHNTFCKYNVQCPDDTYDLHYFMVNFDVEAPNNDDCLDFLRYHFTATGAPVETDACGLKDDLSSGLKSGVHGHGLTLDFRSNRISRTKNFFLSISCIIPAGSGSRKRRNTLLQVADTQPVTENAVSDSCTPSKTLTSEVIRDPYNEPKPEDYLSMVFHREKPPPELRQITVTRTGVVQYKDKTLIIMEGGKTLYRFRDIAVLRVNNRIENDLVFTGNAKPRDREFPGYGYIQIGKDFAEYAQTLVEPDLLLNEKEELIVRDLYQELFNRQKFDAERFYFARPKLRQSARVNCSVNELAELNAHSCTTPLRVVADFFLRNDPFIERCTAELDPKKKI